MYGSIYNGEFFKSTNSGNSFRLINDEDDDSIYFADLHEATHKKIFNSFQEFLNHLQNG